MILYTLPENSVVSYTEKEIVISQTDLELS